MRLCEFEEICNRLCELNKYVEGCVSLKKSKSQDKAVEVAVNSKEENSQDFCLDFVQEFGLWT
jgi:hypothetical protein